MTLVAWILALVGAGLALAIGVGRALSVHGRLELGTVLAVVPLPALAVWFTAPDLYRAVEAGTPLQDLVFAGGPLVIGAATLFLVFRAYVARSGRNV
jgi:hypothetical protein